MQLIEVLIKYFTQNKYAFTLFINVITLSSCSQQEPVALQQAASVIKYMMSTRQLSRSAFAAFYPGAKPSQFVSFLFSDTGTVEWPYGKTEAGLSGIEREQLQATGAPMVPGNVAFIPLQKDPGQGQQLVVKYDDGRGVVIVEGYLDPANPPVLRREWPLPVNITPAPY